MMPVTAIKPVIPSIRSIMTENYQLYQNIEKNVSDASQMFVTNYIKGDHIRLNEVYWGYDLPEWLLSRQNVFKRINVYVQASDLGDTLEQK